MRKGGAPQEGARGLHTHGCHRQQVQEWIEARPIATVKSDQALEFFLDIIHRFGVPNSIITDNSTQFTARKFHKFRNDYNIKVDWAVVAHPRTNGQVERANDMIL